MRFWPQIIGVMVGVGAALIALEARSRSTAPHPAMPMLSETGGALHEIVIQYVSGDEIAFPVYQSFLPQLAPDVIVYVASPDAASFEELRSRLSNVRARLMPIVTGHEMTVWSRDRWAALGGTEDSPVTLLTPRDENAAEIWPTRAGDARVGGDIARVLSPRVTSKRLPVYFDGGDLLADDERVFITPAVLRRNLEQTVDSRQVLTSLLERELGRPVAFLDESPNHHAGMFMMSAGNRTMLVGDPSLGSPFIGPGLPELPGGADSSERTQHAFDAVANQVAALGYRVVRIPVVLAPDGLTYLTYVNAITETRDGRQIVYLPAYRGAESLNESGAQVWRDLGYTVVPIDCTSSYRHFGNLHCLVNVLSRKAV